MKRLMTLFVLLFGAVSGVMAQKQYRVGDYYNENGREGVVFEVDEMGQHGKIVHLYEPEKLIAWCTDSYLDGVEMGAYNQEDGATNMVIILKQAKDVEKFPAIAWCLAQGEGWYLPAINELKTLLLNDEVRMAVNRTLTEHGGETLISVGEETEKKKATGSYRGTRNYWSSTEYPYFANQYQDNSFSNVTNRVAKARYIRMGKKKSSSIYSEKYWCNHVRAIAVF